MYSRLRKKRGRALKIERLSSKKSKFHHSGQRHKTLGAFTILFELIKHLFCSNVKPRITYESEDCVTVHYRELQFAGTSGITNERFDIDLARNINAAIPGAD
jgi:hypothetical protein